MAKSNSTFKAPSWAIALLVVLVIGGWVAGQYNTLVNLDVDVENAWADVETQYQRRADLVPQLVETVSGAAEFEQSTFTEVTEARTNWLNTQADDSASLQDQFAAASSFDSAFSRLLVTVESYPNLTAGENFLVLQSELEGTENRVAIAREDFNEVASVYNKGVRRFPMMLFAKMFGFEQSPLFEAAEGAEAAPTVEFDF